MISARTFRAALVLAAAVFLQLLIAQSQNKSAFDHFGGADLALAKGTGRFRTFKAGDRWMLLTPEGHPFWIFGVYNITTDDHRFPTPTSLSYSDRVAKKYGDPNLAWGPQTVRRLKSWGFNTIGPYSTTWVTPTQEDSRWPGDHSQPVKAPMIVLTRVSYYSFYNLNGYGTAPVKDLIAGVKDNKIGYKGGHFPDVFDPAFDAFANGMIGKDESQTKTRHSPWVIGYMSDDTDDLWGFGAGPEFDTTPKGHGNDNLALVALITSPTQASNPSAGGSGRVVTYKDQKVYTKAALADFLQRKYGSIQALNTAWGSNYTSFSSDGGWGSGSGLLDEDLHPGHRWLGTDTVNLSDFRPAVRADLKSFLVQISREYFTICRTRMKQWNPGSIYFGVSSVGSWNAPPHREVLEGAAGLIDLVATNVDAENEAQINFLEANLGDVPIVEWTGWRSNPDSAMSYFPRDTDFRTQSERARAYANRVRAMWDARTRGSGSHPFVGHIWWEFHDNVGENSNWGLVSLSDNAYDGREAVRAPGRDPWGFTTGGEAGDYGDFLSVVKETNFKTLAALDSTARSAETPKGNH